MAADLTRPEAVQAAAARIRAEYGRIDVLVNNAGGDIGPAGATGPGGGRPPINDGVFIALEDLRAVIDRNLLSCIYVCREVAPEMIERRAGRIVTLGSVAGLSGRADGVMYATAKAAVHEYTRCLAAQLRPYNVTVNCVAPGGTMTPRFVATGQAKPGVVEHVGTLQGYGRPEDIAHAVAYFVTDAGSHVLGPGAARRRRRSDLAGLTGAVSHDRAASGRRPRALSRPRLAVTLPRSPPAGSAQLVAVAEPSPRLRERLGREHAGVALHPTHDALLERSDLDAVLIFADNRASAELGVRALGRGLPVLVEKPMAADLAGEALLAAARASGLPLMVNWPTAWRPALRHGLALVLAGRVGEPVQLSHRAVTPARGSSAARRSSRSGSTIRPGAAVAPWWTTAAMAPCSPASSSGGPTP